MSEKVLCDICKKAILYKDKLDGMFPKTKGDKNTSYYFNIFKISDELKYEMIENKIKVTDGFWDQVNLCKPCFFELIKDNFSAP